MKKKYYTPLGQVSVVDLKLLKLWLNELVNSAVLDCIATKLGTFAGEF